MQWATQQELHLLRMGWLDLHPQSPPQPLQGPKLGQLSSLLLQAITSLPTWQDGTMPGRVVIDIANEPSLFSIKWNRTSTYNGVQFPSWPELYTAATEVRSSTAAAAGGAAAAVPLQHCGPPAPGGGMSQVQQGASRMQEALPWSRCLLAGVSLGRRI